MADVEESLIPADVEDLAAASSDDYTYEFTAGNGTQIGSLQRGVLEIDRLPGAGGQSVLRQSSWFHSATIIVGEIMGTGVMGLPAATAKLGALSHVAAPSI